MYQFLILSDIWAELTWDSVLSVRSGFPNGTNGIPISFKVLPMVPLVIPFEPMGMPMVPLALPMVQLVTLAYQRYHWLPMVPLVKLPMVHLGEPRTEPKSGLNI